MKIGFWEINDEEKKEYFSKNLTGHDLKFFDFPLNADSLPSESDFDVISVFTGSQITPQVIDFFGNLKLIAVRATGFDNIDVKYAGSKNVTVSNVPAYGSNTVAEFTFGLILSLSRHIPTAVNRLKVGFEFDFEGLRGFDLIGKTLGVVGTGKIGINVIKIAKGFGMNVVASDHMPKQELADSLGFTYFPLEEVLKNADIVTLHVPLMDQTRHLINRENIKLMKKGALLINTSRGPVVETEGLFQAITQGLLSGAALDVIEEEVDIKEEAELLVDGKLSSENNKTILQNHILINLPNVYVTPHMAFYTKEAEESILETTVLNIKSKLEGKPENVV